VGERLHPLGRGVTGLDPNAALGVTAVAVRGAVELALLDAEADRSGDAEERRVAPGRVVAFETVADSRQLFAVGLGDVEHGDELEAPDDVLGLAVFGFGVLVDDGGENPDGFLTPPDEAVHLRPRVEARHLVCLVALGGDENHVVEAVAVQLGLEVQVALPLLGRREVADPLCQLLDEFPVVVLCGHC